MEPIKNAQSATHFKWVEARLSNNDTSKTKRYLTPYPPGALNAIEGIWVRCQTRRDFMKAVRKSGLLANQKNIEFTNHFGNYTSHLLSNQDKSIIGSRRLNSLLVAW